MFLLTARQRIAAMILLIMLVAGGFLLFLSNQRGYTRVYNGDISQNQVYVYMCGAVKNPGVITIKPGARKFEAIEKAGGALPEADLNRINLAEYVEDGEQVYLPKKGEVIELKIKKRSTGKTPKTTLTKKETPEKIKNQWPLDLNNATQKQLEEVPGIGAFLASKIVEFRSKNGRFQSFDDLDKVYGIGPGKLEKLRSYLIVK